MLLGVTDRTTIVFIPDSASTDGSGKTGLVAANLTVSFTRVETDNDVTVSDVTGSMNDLASLTAAHNDWGWFEVSNTVAPGLYRLDLADAVFASGAWMAVVYVMVTTSAAAATPKAYRLVAVNALDAVRMGMTALPNAAADAAGGLPISDAGGLDLDAQVGTKINSILEDTGTTGVPAVNGNVTGSVASIAAGGIAANSFAAGAIDAAAIAANAIGASEIADGAIDAATFAAGAITATVIATGAIDADALAADAVDEIWDEVMEGTTTARQSMRLANSANGAIVAGAATTTVTIRDLADSKDRVTATVDANGNRTAVVLDLA